MKKYGLSKKDNFTSYLDICESVNTNPRKKAAATRLK